MYGLFVCDTQFTIYTMSSRTVSFTTQQYTTTEGNRVVMVMLQYQGITTDPVTVYLRTIDNTSSKYWQ